MKNLESKKFATQSIHGGHKKDPVSGALTQADDQRADGQHVVREDEVLETLDVANTRNLETCPHVEAERARKRQHDEQNTVDGNGLGARPAPLVHGKCDDAFEHGDDG